MVHMITRRSVLRAAAATMAGLALGACQPKVVEVTREVEKVVEKEVTKIVAGTPQVVKETVVVEKAAQPAPKKAVTIRAHFPSGAYADFAQKRADTFNQTYQGTTVKIESIAGAEYFAKTSAMYATKQLGDIIWRDNVNGQLQEMRVKGVFRPIDDLVAAENFDLSVYLPTVVDTMTYNGKLYGLCFHAHPGNGHVYTNLKYFQEAGLDPNFNGKTFEDLIQAAQKLTVKSGDKVERWGWGPFYNYPAIVCSVRTFGGETISKDGTKSQLDQPEARNALQWIYDMMYKYQVGPNSQQVEDNVQAMFLAGKIAIWHGSAHLLPSLKKQIEDRFPWSVSPLPPGPTGARGHDTTVHLMQITSTSQNAEDAWPFLKYLTNYEAGVMKVLMGAGTPGGRFDCNTDKSVLEYAPQWAIVYEAFKDARPQYDAANVRTTEAAPTVENNLGNLWLNKWTVDEAISKTHAALQALLDQPSQF